MDLPDSDRGDFSCQRAVDSSSFNRNYTEIHYWGQATFLMAYFIDAYASVDFKEFTHIC